jgi:hypothetical protein
VDVLVEDSKCTVPPEVLTEDGGKLRVGVFGVGENGRTPTIWAEVGTIQRGAEPSGIEPGEHTQPLIDQLLAAAQAARAAADEAERLAQSVRNDADAGAFDGAPGKPGEPGAPGAPGVPGDDYVLTDEDRADIALDVVETVLERATVSGNPLVISDGVGGTRPLSLLCEVEAAEAVTLTRTGKNIWDSARFLEADGWTLEEDGSYSGYNSELYYSFGRSGKSMFGNTAWNEQVTVSFDLRKGESSTTENAIEIVLNYADGTKTSRQNRGSSTWQHCSVSSTIGKTITSIQFSYGGKTKIWLKNFQVEFNGADTGYQPYAATVYQLPIPDAPASGTIDLTDAARDAVTMLDGANVVFADCTSLTMTYPVRPAGSGEGGSGGNVQSVNGKTGEVVLSASDVHALPDTTEIPSRTSQLQNDSGYLTQHQSLAAYRTAAAQDEIDQQQNTAIAAKYVKPASGIPASDLEETYLTQHQDISGKLDKAQGVAHAGEFVVVGSDGNITTQAMTNAETEAL